MTGLPFTIVSLTQHWYRRDGAWYRHAWIRDDVTGCLECVGILDDLLDGEL